VARNATRSEFPWGSIRTADEIVYRAQDEHPEAASIESEMQRIVRAGGRDLVWQGLLEFRSDAESFHYRYTRRLVEGERVIREKTWRETIPRDFQ
jgi:hypothetical protein